MAWKFYTNTGAQKTSALSPVGYGTTLPASPGDGQEYYLVDSLTSPTWQWMFRYNAGSSNTDKWEFLGGTYVIAVQTTDGTSTSASYVDPSNVCSFTVPRAGVYRVRWSSFLKSSTGSTTTGGLALKKGSASTADAETINPKLALSANEQLYGQRQAEIALAASDVLKLQTKSDGAATVTARQQVIEVTPVRVS